MNNIYYSLQTCKPQNIILDSFEKPGYIVGRFIFVSNRISQKEQAITIIHECLHGTPEFEGKSTTAKRNETIESLIESEAQDIYQNRPHIREYVLKQLRIAKGRNENA